MGAVVVEGAEQLGVGEAGPAASGPGDDVVGFAERCGHRAADLGAAAVAEVEGLADGVGDQPSGAADVEDLAVGAEDDGDDPGLAGEPSAWPAVIRLAGRGGRGARLAEQRSGSRGRPSPRWRCRRAGAGWWWGCSPAARRTPPRVAGPAGSWATSSGAAGAIGPYGVSTVSTGRVEVVASGCGVGVEVGARGGRRRGRGSGRAGRRTRRRGGGSRAGSPQTRGVPRPGVAGSRLPRRCRGPGTPATGSRRPAAHEVPASRPRSRSGSRPSPPGRRPDRLGRASRASVITRTWARFRSPVAKASATPVQRRSRASASAAWRRTAPGASRVAVASQWAVDRSPVSMAMSSAAARTRSCRAMRAAEAGAAQQGVLLLAGGQVDGVHPATSSRAASRDAIGARSGWFMDLAKHRPPTLIRAQKPVVHRVLSIFFDLLARSAPGVVTTDGTAGRTARPGPRSGTTRCHR